MIKILVDSASDINLAEANKLGIYLVSMTITFGDVEYADGVDLTNTEFFEKLIESDTIPKTSQINRNTFEEKFDELTADGSDVLCITIASKLSGTFNNAKKASEKYNGKVVVIDSQQACVGERILVDYAIRLASDETLTLADISAKLNEKKAKIELIALLDTLKFLRKGGRISSFAAVAGELLSIKPVICVKNGEIKQLGKAMGSKKGNNLLNQLVEKCGGIDFTMPYALAYSGLSDILLQKYLRDSDALWKDHVNAEDIPTHMIGSTIGTHAGPGAIAVAFFAK